MTQNNYIFPLDITIDATEKDKFTNGPLLDLIAQFKSTSNDLTHVSVKPEQQFKHTIDKVNAVLNSIDLRVYKATMFMSGSDVIGKNIHCDGIIDSNNNAVMLEARINMYEMSEGTCGIEWWDSLPNNIPESNAYEEPWWKTPKLLENPNGPHPFVICLPPFRHALRNGKITWDDIPKPSFSTTITNSSAFVRTNVPHHIIQDNGVRVTLSLSISFRSGLLHGVWDHICRNIHILNNETTSRL
jgi:hypothetical protein